VRIYSLASTEKIKGLYTMLQDSKFFFQDGRHISLSSGSSSALEGQMAEILLAIRNGTESLDLRLASYDTNPALSRSQLERILSKAQAVGGLRKLCIDIRNIEGYLPVESVIKLLPANITTLHIILNECSKALIDKLSGTSINELIVSGGFAPFPEISMGIVSELIKEMKGLTQLTLGNFKLQDNGDDDKDLSLTNKMLDELHKKPGLTVKFHANTYMSEAMQMKLIEVAACLRGEEDPVGPEVYMSLDRQEGDVIIIQSGLGDYQNPQEAQEYQGPPTIDYYTAAIVGCAALGCAALGCAANWVEEFLSS
jgi:hypothetical protein